MSSKRRNTWRCDYCRNKGKSQEAKSLENTESGFVDDIKQIKKIVEQMKIKLDRNCEDCGKIAKEYELMRKRQEELKESMEKIEQNVSDLLQENRKKDKTIKFLTDKVAELEQERLEKNIEIFGVEENENEVLEEIVLKVTERFGIKLKSESLEDVKRNGRDRSGKGRPIVVKLRDIKVKNLILKKREDVRNNEIVGGSNSERIKIFSHLTAFNKKLLWEARKKALEAQWKFVWASGSRILARKDESTKVHHLKSNAELEIIC